MSQPAPAVVVVTTKPSLNEAEYAVQNPDGSYLIHGVRIDMDLGSLSPEDQAALGGARAVLQRLAQEDAIARGFVTA
jgi:hypothetical protein